MASFKMSKSCCGASMACSTWCNLFNNACSSLTIEAWASVRMGAASRTGVLLMACRSPRGLREGREDEENDGGEEEEEEEKGR